MWAEVTGCTEADGLWLADSVDIACSNWKCEQLDPGPMDHQGTWQPVIDRIIADINSKWHFGRVSNVA